MSSATDKIQFQKLSDKAIIPIRAHEGDAGYDLFSSVCDVIPPRSHKLIKTDICVRLPKPPMEGTSVYGRIAPRSGLTLKKAVDTGAGVVDVGYRGPLGVIMFNHSDVDFEVKVGDRIAQLLISVIMTSDVEEVDNISTENTERKGAGFGSTGV